MRRTPIPEIGESGEMGDAIETGRRVGSRGGEGSPISGSSVTGELIMISGSTKEVFVSGREMSSGSG